MNNKIKLKSEAKDKVEKTTIEQALFRSSHINGKEIQIQVNCNKIALRCKEHSLT